MSSMPNARIARRPAAKPAGKWPGLSQEASDAAQMLMNNKLPSPSKWRVTRHKYFHRVDYAAAGQSQIQLFNVAPTDFICNLPLQGTLPAETFFKLTCIRIVPEVGVGTAASSALNTNAINTDAANGHLSTQRTAALTTVDTVAGVIEDLRVVFQTGALTVKCGDRPIVDNVYGLHNFPGGSVPTCNGAYGGTAAASTMSHTMLFSNGEPNNINGWFLTPPFPVLPQKQIRGSLNWQAALAVNDAFVLRVELEGTLLSPANG